MTIIFLSDLLEEGAGLNPGGPSHIIRTILQVWLPNQVMLICGKMTLKQNIILGQSCMVWKMDLSLSTPASIQSEHHLLKQFCTSNLKWFVCTLNFYICLHISLNLLFFMVCFSSSAYNTRFYFLNQYMASILRALYYFKMSCSICSSSSLSFFSFLLFSDQKNLLNSYHFSPITKQKNRKFNHIKSGMICILI